MPKKSKSNQSKTSYPIGKQAGKTEINKEPDFYHKHKSTIWTVIIMIVLTVFFIINNTREVPKEGPYPPNYNQGKTENESL
jgi:hypothetical protein